MITIKRDLLFAVLGILSLLVELSIFSNNNYLLSFFIFIYLCTVPGYLLFLSIKINKIDFWTSIVLSVGLSLFFLMIPGVIFNFLWSQLMPTAPLQKELLFVFYGSLILILGSIAYLRNREYELKFSIEFWRVVRKIYFLIPPIITVLSTFAAIRLNNNASNSLAIISLSGIALSTLVTIFLHNRISKHFFPWSLYFHSLSLLLLLSLRSWYVSGWDIQNEFKIFQVTKDFGVWHPENWNNAYNACLSITLLPAVISKLTAFPDEYIYKAFYQILFAIAPVIVYQTFKRYVNAVIAYIAVIYIISQPLFIQPMTALMRQEIAYIFFPLLFFVLFEDRISFLKRSSLFLIFGVSMIVSHYSTTYVSLILLLITSISVVVLRLTEKLQIMRNFYKKIKLSESGIIYKYYLNPLLVLILFLCTVFWYGTINNQLGQVQQVAKESLANMNKLFRDEAKSSDSHLATTFMANGATRTEDIEMYVKNMLREVGGESYRLYPAETYVNDKVFPLQPQIVPPILASPGSKYIFIGFEFLKQILKFCVILGPLYLFLLKFRNSDIPREYIVLGGFSILFIVIMTFHPTLGLQYNLTRFYLQLLFYLSLPAFLLFFFILLPIKKHSIRIVGVLITLLFIYLSGLTYQLFGGEARMYLNNYGADFDKTYVHNVELSSAAWMRAHVDNRSILYADQEANLRIARIYDRGINRNTIPALIYKDSYVYGSYANVIQNRTIIHNEGASLLFTFPQLFLEENKSVIYNNGGSKIYR